MSEVTHDVSSGSSNTLSSSLTFSHTCAPNAKLLLVSLYTRDTASLPVTGVTYGGVSMTLVSSANRGTQNIAIYKLVNPKSGANNVVISCNAVQNSITAISSSFKNHATQINGLASGIPTNSTSATAEYASPTDIAPGLTTQQPNEKAFMMVGNNNINQNTNANSTELRQQFATSVFMLNDPVPNAGSTASIRVNDLEGETLWILTTLTPNKGAGGMFAGS